MTTINVQDKIALVTGANRGIGRAIVIELVKQGALKVYAAARDSSKLAGLVGELGDRVVPLQLDVTNDAMIKVAVEEAGDIDILINNAGVFAPGNFTQGGVVEGLTDNFAVNVFGVAKLIEAYLPNLKKREAAAVVTVSSMVGLASMPMGLSYSASKAAAHSIIQGLRGEVKDSNILVAGVYPGPIDTDMIRDFPMEKDTPENVAAAVVQGINSGTEDIFPDAMAAQAGAAYLASPKAAEEMFATFV
ncbi:MAG: SDR family NAD(P)-dependent oxidoreductase [Fibrobacterales bacterium]